MGYFSDLEARLPNRQVDELIGLSRAIIVDRLLTDDEIDFLREWLSRNQAVWDQPLAGDLFNLLNRLLAQKQINDTERQQVVDMMQGLVGTYGSNGRTTPATLPIDSPEPVLEFPGKNYCFTGTFDYGNRRSCWKAVWDHGGEIHEEVLRDTDYLVIGAQATGSWKHSSFGNKIKKAVALRDEGRPIAIVSELHWQAHF